MTVCLLIEFETVHISFLIWFCLHLPFCYLFVSSFLFLCFSFTIFFCVNYFFSVAFYFFCRCCYFIYFIYLLYSCSGDYNIYLNLSKSTSRLITILIKCGKFALIQLLCSFVLLSHVLHLYYMQSSLNSLHNFVP